MGASSEPSRKRKPKYTSWDGNINNLDPLGNGVSGVILGIDEKRVAKIDIGSQRSVQDIEIERDIYRRLNQQHNKHVLWCFELDNPSGLVLERCDDTIRKRLRSRYRNTAPPEDLVKRWACEAAQGLAYIHRCGVIQVDVGCHNMLLSADDTVKLGDFAGSSIDGLPSTVDYEVKSKLPNAGEPSQITDIFALGSAMWEMATGSPPYEELSWREVRGLYKRGKFPRLKSMPELDRIIRKCWQQRYRRAQDVVDDLEATCAGFEATSTSASQESLEFDPSKPSRSERQPYTKHTYVDHAKNPRHRPRAYNFDKGNKKPTRKEKQREEKSVGFFTKSFGWLSYTYGVSYQGVK